MRFQGYRSLEIFPWFLRPAASWWGLSHITEELLVSVFNNCCFSSLCVCVCVCVCVRDRERGREGEETSKLGCIVYGKSIGSNRGGLLSESVYEHLFLYHKYAGVLEMSYILTWVEYLYAKVKVYISDVCILI